MSASYRFQVWAMEDLTPENRASDRQLVRAPHGYAFLAKLLWEEPPGREFSWTVPQRSISAYEHVLEFRQKYPGGVCYVTVPTEGGECTPHCYEYPAFSTSVRDLLLLTAEGGAR